MLIAIYVLLQDQVVDIKDTGHSASDLLHEPLGGLQHFFGVFSLGDIFE
ncbi:MAG: hypothetical protein HC893_07855 [Chloroflexaceae bacterium]|nr:hypothetical protein [Chloroflexaceae bacterium]